MSPNGAGAPPNINVVSLAALLWTLTAVATLATAGRYVIRYQVRRSFYWDDLAHLVAWVFLIGYSGVTHDTFATVEKIIGVSDPKPDAIIAFRKRQVALTMLFIFCLWFVKFAFMYLYRLLFWASPVFRKLWWSVMVILIITVWLPIAGDLTGCGPVSDIYDPKACAATQARYQKIALTCMCTVHVATDLLVLVLPWYIIPKIQVTLAKKIGLVAIFSVGLITIACDILRTVKSFSPRALVDVSVYTSVEISLAVIVSSLPIYRKLFNFKPKEKAKKSVDRIASPKYGMTEPRLSISTSSTVPKKGVSKAKFASHSHHGPNKDPRSQQGDQPSHALQELRSAHLTTSSHSIVQASSMV